MKFLVFDIGVKKIDPKVKEERFYDNKKKLVNERKRKNKL